MPSKTNVAATPINASAGHQRSGLAYESAAAKTSPATQAAGFNNQMRSETPCALATQQPVATAANESAPNSNQDRAADGITPAN